MRLEVHIFQFIIKYGSKNLRVITNINHLSSALRFTTLQAKISYGSSLFF